MLYDKTVSQNYLHGDLLNSIEDSLSKIGKTVDTVDINDLAPVDEFHTGSRLATENLLDQLKFAKRDHILDVGSGIGGAARFVASKYNNRVTGIDLSKEYIKVGKTLSKWVGLDDLVTLIQGSAVSMPFEDGTFDGGYMLHVGMNIEDKAQLFSEIYRVLRSKAFLGIYDIMRQEDGELAYPVPWATEKSTSKLSTPKEYKQALSDAGFVVSKVNNRRGFALEFFKKLRAKMKANGGPAPLGLHILMKETTPIKIKNMVDNVSAGYIAPVEIIAQKS